MEQDEKFLPEKMDLPMLPKEWNPKMSVEKIGRLTTIAKPAVADIVKEFWIAHEMIVTKKISGWTWVRFCKETGYSHIVPYQWFEKYGMTYTKTSHGSDGRKLLKNFNNSSSLPRPVTSKEDREVLEKAADILRKKEVNEDDIKDTVEDAIAEGIKKKKFAPRAGTKIAREVRNVLKVNAEVKQQEEGPKDPDNFYRLSRHALALQEGLHFWADGTIKPETKEEMDYARIVRNSSGSIIANYARLGIDVVEIYDTLRGRKEKRYDERLLTGGDGAEGDQVDDSSSYRREDS